MRIAFIEAAGFRGIRDVLRIDVPPGFLIVSGPNGSGKTTICDLLEFCLTGALNRDEAGTEKGESLKDYFWWRGPKPPKSRYVKVGFLSDQGEQVTITRTPDEADVRLQNGVLAQLIDLSVAPKASASELARTTIIRDATIEALSLELPETERYAFVRSAVGTADVSSIESRLKAAIDILEAREKKTETEYGALRERVASLLASISEVRTQAMRVEDTSAAEAELRAQLGRQGEGVADLLAEGRRALAEVRVRSEQLSGVLLQWTELETHRATVEGDEFRVKLAELSTKVEWARVALATSEEKLILVQRELDIEDKVRPILASLAELHEHGQRVGLQQGGCPLCGTELEPEVYERHLRVVRERVEATQRHLNDLVRRRADLRDQVARLTSDLENLTTESSQLSAKLAELQHKEKELLDDVAEYGLELVQGMPPAAQISRAIDTGRRRAMSLERNMALLEASVAVERLATLESKLTESGQLAESAERQLAKLQSAVGRAKNAYGAVRRLAGEIVEERLASLSPLLRELYQRLRPHVEWLDVGYHLRGDVRRFLSLRVGGDLNPRFIFSRGQRRAAGLGFLLAVHLSRPWCRLRCLVLDDPVQHIDDYRALHSVEVLAAIRQTGEQVICTAEDGGLADLMCRRLRSGGLQDGKRISLAYEVGQGVRVADEKWINPYPDEILLSA